MTATILYLLVGAGVAVGLHCHFTAHRPDRWHGATLIAGVCLIVMLWPVAVIALATLWMLAMITAIDR